MNEGTDRRDGRFFRGLLSKPATIPGRRASPTSAAAPLDRRISGRRPGATVAGRPSMPSTGKRPTRNVLAEMGLERRWSPDHRRRASRQRGRRGRASTTTAAVRAARARSGACDLAQQSNQGPAQNPHALSHSGAAEGARPSSARRHHVASPCPRRSAGILRSYVNLDMGRLAQTFVRSTVQGSAATFLMDWRPSLEAN